MNEKIGVRLIEHKNKNLKSLIGKSMIFESWTIIDEYEMHLIDMPSNDKIFFYGNKSLDLCFRFEEEWDDRCIRFLELTDVFYYPEFYEKSNEQMNSELINSYAIGLSIKNHLFNDDKVDENTYANYKIEAYEQLKKNNRLL